jgi:alpha-galactosidase
MELIQEINNTRLLRDKDILVLEGKMTRLVYHLDIGMFDFVKGNLPALKNAFSKAVVKNGCCITSKQGVRSLSGYGAVWEGSLSGLKMSVTVEDGGLKLIQNFTVYSDAPFILTSLELCGEEEVSTNYMVPIIACGESGSLVDPGAGGDIRALFVPYDNDYWVRYVSCPIGDAKPGYVYPDDRRPRKEEMFKEGIRQSYEVASIFDNTTRKGLVMGSVSHEIWKTGIKITGASEGIVAGLEVYCGCADRYTRDYLSHGFVKGMTLASASIFIGCYEDYRDGLEEFGKLCAALNPPMKWDDDAIFGWNAYAGYEDKMDFERFVHASDFMKQNLQSKGFSHKGKLYVNFDYLWANLSEQELCKTVEIARENGQYAGIYFAPFSVFTDELDTVVEGTDGHYTYRDIILKDYEGNPLPKVNDGNQGYAADPTHPGNLMRVEHTINRFVKWGFRFVKLDFITHGSLEGGHYNPDIVTGKQAYNFGMKHLCGLLSYEKIVRPFFISLSIAPAFPCYGHSRRISCDAFGHIEDSEYMLNSLSYGWWMNGSIYRFNDPDHIVIDRRMNCPGSSEQEARTRINSGIICGGMFLDSDAFLEKTASDRAVKYLTNEKVTSLAQKGLSFRPVEGNSGDRAVDVFYRDDGDDFYLAVFNYGEKAVVKNINLVRVGLRQNKEYTFEDLWDKSSMTGKGMLAVSLEACESVILRTREK